MDNFGLDGVQWQDVKAVSVCPPKPYDAEVEYLESTGTQWIDTGIKGGPGLRLECRGKYKYRATTLVRAGGIVSGTSYSIFLLTGSSLTNIQGAYNSSGPFNLAVNIPFDSWFDAALENRTLTVNGTTVSSASYTVPELQGNLGIFGYVPYLPDASTPQITSGVIASVRIFKDGTLVRDYIPVRKNGVGYLYDKVSGQLFGNQGTGNFLYGSDTGCHSVDKLERGGTTLWRKPPYDAEVDYLESTGTQYIDTGVVPDASTIWTMRYLHVTSNAQVTMGVGTYNKRFGFGFGANNTVAYMIMAVQKSFSGTVDNSVPHTVSLSGTGAASLDGIAGPAAVSISGISESIFLIAQNDSGNASLNANRRFRIYWSTIQKGGATVRDYIPVRVGTTGYLFDKVSWTLFGNAGTGAFAYGPDKY